ncbi:MAG: hypothetical protein MJ229_00555 [bacterium]|nr:hypothetical protein [bacterium]
MIDLIGMESVNPLASVMDVKSVAAKTTEEVAISDNANLLDYNFSKENSFKLIAKSKVTTFEDFSKDYQTLTGKNINSDEATELYKEYMNFRGCNDEKDLEALNKVTNPSCLTKDDLKTKAINDLMFGLLMLATVGLNPNIKREDLGTIIEGATTEELAEFVNNFDTAKGNNSTGGMLEALANFADKVSDNETIPPELREKLASFSKEVKKESEASTIDLMFKVVDKANEYNQKLIENYKSEM